MSTRWTRRRSVSRKPNPLATPPLLPQRIRRYASIRPWPCLHCLRPHHAALDGPEPGNRRPVSSWPADLVATTACKEVERSTVSSLPHHGAVPAPAGGRRTVGDSPRPPNPRGRLVGHVGTPGSDSRFFRSSPVKPRQLRTDFPPPLRYPSPVDRTATAASTSAKKSFPTSPTEPANRRSLVFDCSSGASVRRRSISSKNRSATAPLGHCRTARRPFGAKSTGTVARQPHGTTLS